MKLLTTASAFDTEFLRLINKYNEFYWVTAWAGINSKQFNELLKRKESIEKITVGLHFFQTHPDFIEAFLNNEKVRFIKQPSGVFHPKLYLFFNSHDNWEVIIGSANFTNAAFTKNTETSVLISDKDSDSKNIYNDAINLINKTWSTGKLFDKVDLEKYRYIWQIQQQKINSLSGFYGSKSGISKPILESKMTNRTWEDFIELVRDEPYDGMEKRLRVIQIAKSLFSKELDFHKLEVDERKFIAGVPNALKIDGAENWGCFGSMKGAGLFKKKVNIQDLNISNALNQIPLSGQITKKHYENFIDNFQKAFIGTRLEGANNLATATRILCMKRPDTFVCFDSENRSNLCRDFGITQTGMSFTKYWDDIIERIYDSNWWQNPMPKSKKDLKVSEARAAFLDSLYYDEIHTK